MNQTCIILLLFVALVSCALSSYLDIPPPPERPLRFKTKEQIENYLKSVKDYYDAFKIKLVRRNDLQNGFARHSSGSNADDDSTMEETMEDLQAIYPFPAAMPSNSVFRRRYRLQRALNID